MFDYQPQDMNFTKEDKPPKEHHFQVEGLICATEDANYYIKDGKANDKYLKDCAKEIKKVFADGFQWKDIGTIIVLANERIVKTSMSTKEKRKAISKILDHLIDITDTPLLPDKIFDPLFKRMIPSMVDLIISEVIFFMEPEGGAPSKNAIKAYGKKVKSILADGFQGSDVPKIIYLALDFANSFVDLTGEQKADIAKDIIDYGLDNSHVFFIGDEIVDNILKKISYSVIDKFFAKK